MARSLLLLCSLVLKLILCICSESSGRLGETSFLIVNTTSGPVKGYKSAEGEFIAFFGIPYATAPSGPKKFSAPLPAPIWEEPLEAVNDNIFCPQVVYPIHWAVTDQYQEDCLIANVFVPDLADEHRGNLSVVVYVHGGSYQVGKGNHLRPYEFMNEAKDVIFVNFNYRVGVHGFLCLGTDDIPGNAGLKDQLAALRWIKKNIAGFGGDAEDITLAGYSAGASAADLLVLSDTTHGLFTKVILDSGVAHAVWSVQVNPFEIAEEFARDLNFTATDVKDLEGFYKNLPFEDLTSDSFSKRLDMTFAFVPCVERDLGQERVLKQAPVDILESGNIKKLPTLIGFADMEGLIRLDQFESWKEIMNEDFSKFLPADLGFDNEEERQRVTLQLKQTYFFDKDINDDTVEDFLHYFGDAMFAYPIIRNIKMQVEAGNNNIYLYLFSYTDDNISPTHESVAIRRAQHCAQTYAVLEESGADTDLRYSVTDEYRQMKTISRKLWINFIKTSKPVPAVTADFPLGWPASSARATPFMQLELPARLHRDSLLTNRIQLWDHIYHSQYNKPIAV